MSESTKIQLKNVRLSFPSLFQRAQFNGEDGKYEATFLFSKKDKKLKDKLDKAIAAKLKEANIKVPQAPGAVAPRRNSLRTVMKLSIMDTKGIGLSRPPNLGVLPLSTETVHL